MLKKSLFKPNKLLAMALLVTILPFSIFQPVNVVGVPSTTVALEVYNDYFHFYQEDKNSPIFFRVSGAYVCAEIGNPSGDMIVTTGLNEIEDVDSLYDLNSQSVLTDTDLDLYTNQIDTYESVPAQNLHSLFYTSYAAQFTLSFAMMDQYILPNSNYDDRYYVDGNGETSDTNELAPHLNFVIDYGNSLSTYYLETFNTLLVFGHGDVTTNYVDLSYSFFPNLILDSEYYDLDNIEVYVSTPITTDWVQQDPYRIHIDHAQYKLKIVDQFSNIIILEDTSYQYFEINREVILDSFQMINNSPEPITIKFNENYWFGDQTTVDSIWDDIGNTPLTDYADLVGETVQADFSIIGDVYYVLFREDDDSVATYTPNLVYNTVYNDWTDVSVDITVPTDAYKISGGQTGTTFQIKDYSLIIPGDLEEFTIDPYSSEIIPFNVSSVYNLTIWDNYENQLGDPVYEASAIEYTPPAQEQCVLVITDNSSDLKPLAFDEFRVYVDDLLITSPVFEAERDAPISIDVNTLQNDTILTYSHDVTPGTNYISIPLPALYLQNNAHEPINVALTENGHYQGLYSWDLDEVHTRPEMFEYSSDGMAYVQNEEDNHNKIMVLDSGNSSDYGSHLAIENFDADLTGWTITGNDADETVTYLSQKELSNGNMYDVLEIWDGDVFSDVFAEKDDFSGNIVSMRIAVSDVSVNNYVWIKEGTTVIGTLNIVGSNIKWSDGAYQNIVSAANNIIYHVTMVFNVEDDEVDFYIDGVFASTQNLANNIETEIDRITLGTNTANTGYIYASQIYVGTALDEAFSSLNAGTAITLDYTEKDYKVDGTVDWGTIENPDLGDWAVSSISLSIENEIADHANSLKVLTTANNAYCYLPFTEVTSGTIETWIYIPSTILDIVYIMLRDGSSNALFLQFETDLDILANTDVSGTSDTGVNYVADTWFHVKITWTKNGAVDFLINGVSVENSKTLGVKDIDRYYALFTDNTDYYYLDGLALPGDGYESFSNMIFQNFKSGDSNIENWGYENYDFKKSDIEEEIQKTGVVDWGTSDDPNLSGFTATLPIIASHENHLNVLQFGSGNSGYDFSETRTTGTIEMFLGSDSTSLDQLRIGDGITTLLIMIRVRDTGIQFFYGDGLGGYFLTTLQAYTGMGHVKITFDTTTDTFSAWVDGSAEVTDQPFYNDDTSDGMTNILFVSSDEAYCDSIGFSWDGYVSGSNRNRAEWTFIGDGSCDVISLLDGHTNILQNTHNTGVNYHQKTFDSMENGIMEWWWRMDTSASSGMYFYRDSTYGPVVFMNSGNFKYHDGVGIVDVTTPTSYEMDTWYHSQIEVNHLSQTYDWYVDGILIGEDLEYRATTASGLNRVYYLEFNGISMIDSLLISEDKSFKNIPSVFQNNGTIEWWQKQANNETALYCNSLSLNWSDTQFKVFDGDYTVLETANQITDTWNHYQITWYDNTYKIYRDNVLLTTQNLFPLNLDYFQFTAFENAELWIDAIDHNLTNSNYIEHQNQILNTSEDLWCWDAFPDWDNYHYQETYDMSSSNHYSDETLEGHTNILNIISTDTTIDEYITFTSFSEGSIEYWQRVDCSLDATWSPQIHFRSGSTLIGYIYSTTANTQSWYDGTVSNVIASSIDDEWHHYKLEFDVISELVSIYVDGILVLTHDIYWNSVSGIDTMRLTLSGVHTNDKSVCYDGFSISSDENYFPGMNLLENTTTSPLSMATNYSTQVNPYSQVFTNYTEANYMVGISDLYDNLLETQLLAEDENEIIYTPPNNEMALISLSDQRSNYLDWENYHLFINGSALYQNSFSRELGTTWNISVYDRFDQYLTSEIYTITRDSNFINIQLTLFSLKIYNQQECFNFVNITRDPNYYSTTEYWSEWAAPSEILEFRLSAGYYKIDIESNENSTDMEFAYNLQSDDILLLTSDNTLSNAIYSIVNVNTTLGNQITSVNISIVNTQTEIENQIITVEINLDNINSTLGNQLISIDTALSNLDSDVETLFLFTNTSLINLNTSMVEQFLGVNTEITNINNTISTLVIGIDNQISLLNASVNTQFTQISNDLVLMESNLNTSLFLMNTTIDQIGNNITENYILLNNTLNLLGNEINASEIAILNNLMLVNNSIMDSITNMLTQVYLINNSIYSAVLNLGTSLAIDNNQILGNLSVVLQLNQELTDLFTETFFAEFLDWTNATIDADFLRDQTDYVTLINKYNTESLEFLFKYLGETESLILGAQDTVTQLIPVDNVTYRIKSIDTGEYLTDWEEIPDNNTIPFGIFEESFSPEDLILSGSPNADIIVAFSVFAVALLAIIFFVRRLKTTDFLKIRRDTYKPKKQITSPNNPISSMRGNK